MNILVIHPTSFIGDTLFVFPTLAAIKRTYPQAHITFVSYALVLPLAQAWGLADDVLDCKDQQWQELSSPEGVHSAPLLDLLRQTDCVIDWEVDTAGIISRNVREAGVINLFIVPENPIDVGTMHVADFMAEAVGLTSIGLRNVVAHYTPPTWNDNDLCLFDPPIAIHPGSTSLIRRWPTPYFATIINQLLRFKYPVLLLAGPSEAETLRELHQHLSPHPQPGMLTVLQNAPLLEVARQIKQCRFFLGNDSGISHLAGLLGVPTLGLYGPTDPAYKRPVGPHVETLEATPLDSLAPDEVMAHILRRL